MTQSLSSILKHARLMENNLTKRVSIVQAGDIKAFVAHISAAMLEWLANATNEDRQGLNEEAFKNEFPMDYEARLCQLAERRRMMVIFPWDTEHPVKIADHESILGLMAAATNPIVVPRDVYRTDQQVIVHFPFQGRLTITRGDEVELTYEPYVHAHFHVRNYNKITDHPGLDQVATILSECRGSDAGEVSAANFVEHGWLIAQKLGAMVTITHQEGGDPEYASYTDYGPYYPLDVLIEEEGGTYIFEPKWTLVVGTID